MPVGNVGANDAHAGNRRADDALLFVGVIRDVVHDILGRDPRKNGDAVIGFLSEEGCVVAGGLYIRQRKFCVLHFQFLQAQRVRLVFVQPVEHMRQAHVE